MWRADSLGKTLMLGKTEGKRRRRQRRMRWLDSISRCEVRRDRQTSGEASASASLKNVGHEKVATELLSSKRQWHRYGPGSGPPPLPLNPQEVSEQHKDMSANKPNIFRLVPASSSWSHRKGVRFCLPNTIFMHLQGPMFFQNPSCKRVRELWILATQLMILEGRWNQRIHHSRHSGKGFIWWELKAACPKGLRLHWDIASSNPKSLLVKETPFMAPNTHIHTHTNITSVWWDWW